jgi:hypothetical protein
VNARRLPYTTLTCLTECVAEFLQRPLMVLTSSDIGTDPEDVENNLTREFKKAKSWNAVLLIDEADVFMEQRSTRDLTRNSLVAGNIVMSIEDKFLTAAQASYVLSNSTMESCS